MKRINHKLVLFFVVVCLTLSLSCFVAGARDMTFTDGIYTYTFANDTLTVTDVDNTASGDVVIPASVEGYPVVGIDPHAFRDCEDIDSLDHEWNSGVINPVSTCKTHGTKTYTCLNNATHQYTEQVPLDSNNHEGGTYIKGISEPTCTTDGYTGDTHCSGCNARLAKGKTISKEHIDTDADNYCDICKEYSVKIIESGKCGDNVTYKWYEDGTIIISGTGDMWNYINGKTSPFQSNISTKSVRCVIVNKGVTSVGFGAFSYRSNLKTVILSADIKFIKEHAFSNCTNLANVFYAGTYEQWKTIQIDSYNEEFDNAVIHYNYCLPLNSVEHKNAIFYELQDSTCTEIGYTSGIYCPDCEKWLSGHETIEATGHSFTDYKSDNNVSYTSDGTKTAHCDFNCGTKDTVVVKGSRLEIGKISKVTATQTATSITLKWDAVEGASGYRICRCYVDDGSVGYTNFVDTKKCGYTISNLTPATVYNYVVYPYVKLDSGITIEKIDFSMNSILSVSTAPEKASEITATQSENAIKLSWNAVPGATGYRVYSYNRATGKYTTLSTIQKTSGTVKNLTPGTEYNYLIRPYVKLADGTLVWASYSKDDIFVTGTIPAKATAITATQSTSAIKLTWKEKGGATGYRVYEYNKTTGKYTKLGTVQKLNGTIKNLKAGTTYGYLVRAYTQLSDGTVLWADYSKNDVFYTATKAVAPTLKATAGTKKFTLSWNKVAGATSYEVWYSNSANGTYKKLTTVTGTTYSKSCTTGKTYYFKVRAMTTVNGQSIKGEASTAKGVKIK